MPASEALLLLEQTLKQTEIDNYKQQQSNYYASLPLWINSEKLPDPPEPPDWIQELIEDE